MKFPCVPSGRFSVGICLQALAVDHLLTGEVRARHNAMNAEAPRGLSTSWISDRVVIAQALKVLIVEDSSVLAQSMSDFITEIPEIDVIGVADSEAVALAAIERRRIDVVLLDLHLRQGTGFGILRALATMEIKPCVVVLTNHHSEQYARDAVALGAHYFLDKANDFERLPRILREIARNTEKTPMPAVRLQ
jgi:DNA-binding NtrC family response regulator